HRPTSPQRSRSLRGAARWGCPGSGLSTLGGGRTGGDVGYPASLRRFAGGGRPLLRLPRWRASFPSIVRRHLAQRSRSLRGAVRWDCPSPGLSAPRGGGWVLALGAHRSASPPWRLRAASPVRQGGAHPSLASPCLASGAAIAIPAGTGPAA